VSAERALQKAIRDALIADATLAGLLAPDVRAGSPSVPGVYDHVPQVPQSEDVQVFPYVVIGEYTAVPFDADDVHGHDSVVVLHVFDRLEGTQRAKQIIGAIYDALHDAALEVEGQSCIYCYWEFSESVPDPDQLTKHEVTRFRVVTQRAS
jgi:hypothetical protein